MLVPVGGALGLLTHSWSTLLVCVFATILVGVAPYMGQGHNEVFVGPRGVRRVARDCDLIATWPSLRAVEIKVSGNRIVVFNLETAGVLVERLTKDRAKPAQALVRNPPEGSQFRLDREAADALGAEGSQRRPDLGGLAECEQASRPT